MGRQRASPPMLRAALLALVLAGCLAPAEETAPAAVAPPEGAGTPAAVAEAAPQPPRLPATERWTLRVALHAPNPEGAPVAPFTMQDVSRAVAVPPGAVAHTLEVRWTAKAPTAASLQAMVHGGEGNPMLGGAAGGSPLRVDVPDLGNLTEVQVMAHGTAEQPAVMLDQEVEYAVTFFFGPLDALYSGFANSTAAR